MDAPEPAAFRELIDRYLSGLETLDSVVPRFITLFTAYLAADDRAPSTGQWSLADLDLHPAHLTDEQQARMQQFYNALLDALPGPAIEYLPPTDNGERQSAT